MFSLTRWFSGCPGGGVPNLQGLHRIAMICETQYWGQHQILGASHFYFVTTAKHGIVTTLKYKEQQEREAIWDRLSWVPTLAGVKK